MSRTFTENVPLAILDGSVGDLVVTFAWSPGSEPSGLSGPPENYDPGSPPEFEIISSHYESLDAIPVGLGEEEEERVVNWLCENFEPPQEPDGDDLRDREIDDRLTGSDE